MCSLRSQVITALEAAGFAHRESSLPTHASGGTFSAYGSDRSGINVVAEWWGAEPAELADQLARMAAVLRATGLEVAEQLGRLYLAPVEG
jgi:hypothetical protein